MLKKAFAHTLVTKITAKLKALRAIGGCILKHRPKRRFSLESRRRALGIYLGSDVLICSLGRAGMTSTEEPLVFSPGRLSSKQSLKTPKTVVW